MLEGSVSPTKARGYRRLSTEQNKHKRLQRDSFSLPKIVPVKCGYPRLHDGVLRVNLNKQMYTYTLRPTTQTDYMPFKLHVKKLNKQTYYINRHPEQRKRPCTLSSSVTPVQMKLVFFKQIILSASLSLTLSLSF
jgi:hypothetical protein